VNLKQKLARLELARPSHPSRHESASESSLACDRSLAEAQTRESRVEVTLDDVHFDELTGEVEQRLKTVQSLRTRLENMRAPRPPVERKSGFFSRRLSAGYDDEPLPRVSAPDVRLPCERDETEHGALFRVVVTHDEDHRHGSAQVVLGRRALAADVAVLALDPLLESVDFSRALYIDTETTGLSGGAGTLPFLIGMAWFEGERLVVEQLLLPRPGLEGPMLMRLAERLAQASAIVSFNGKSFDWPLLRTRFILNRIAAPKPPYHLDLLHCARRVYKSRLGSVRLIHLEQELLGFERIGDIAGELIPQTYLAFLRGVAPGSTLTPIIEHNRSDLVALPALLGEIVGRFASEHVRQDARDQLGFARVAARSSKSGAASERAIAFAHAAVESDVRGELAAHALYLVGELKLRQGELHAAIEAFERALLASSSAFDRARAHLALAKLHEHKTKQPERALSHAEQTGAFEGEEASERRSARLRVRLQRRATSAVES
jgi:uncharacterized protein